MTQPPPPPTPYGAGEPDPSQPPPTAPYASSGTGPHGQAAYGPGAYGQTPYPPAGYGPGAYGQAPPGAPQSKALGGWALGLAIAFCLPFATLVSIVLAIVTLVQSRDGRDRGRGMAIAALVIDGVVVLVSIVAVLLVIGVASFPTSPERDSQGRVTARHEISTFDIREGDCIDDPALMAAGEDQIEVAQAQAVPCGQAHDLEAYRVFDLQGDDYPGNRVVVRRATLGCLQGFADFVGRSYRSSEAEFWTYYPQQRSWDLLDDRAVVCLVGIPDEKTTGTLEGSER